MSEQPTATLSSTALDAHNQSHSAMLVKRLTERYGSGVSNTSSGAAPNAAEHHAPRAAATRGSASAQPIESELSAIRREMQGMQREMTRDMEMDALKDEMSSEIRTLYEDLQRAVTKLEAERSLRRKIEAELDIVREDRIVQTSAVVKELEGKRAEIQTLREERGELKQWLDRGAAECRRVADEVLSLRSQLEQTEQSCSMLKDVKAQQLRQVQELTEQLSAVQQKLQEVHHEKALLEIRLRETTEAIRVAEVSKSNSAAEMERLESELARLNHRVRGASEAGHALGVFCAAVAELVVQLKSLDQHVRDGTLTERYDKPLVYLRPQPLPQVSSNSEDHVVASKVLVTNVTEAARALESTIRRFVLDKQRERTEEQRMHQDELAALHREKEVELQRYNVERQALEMRGKQLERELLTVAAGVQEQVEVEASSRLQHLEDLITKNRELQQENASLVEQNRQLQAKARKMKIDWAKVDESRIRLQQLQMELSMMNEYSERLTNENRNLRLLVQSTAAVGSSTNRSSAHAPLDHAAFEQWKLQAMSELQ